MKMLRSLRTFIVSIVVFVLAAAGLVVGVIAAPEPFFHYAEQRGRLWLYSDEPFEPAAADAVLADVERRLAGAPAELVDAESTYRIFVVNAEWRRRLFFLDKYGTGGVNYFPIAGNVFVRQAEVGRDRVLRNDGSDVPAPRTLAYYGAHEIGHSLIGRRAGAIVNWTIAAWIREGLADYIGFGGEVGIDDLTARLNSGDLELDPASGHYALYRLMVALLLERKGWSVGELFATTMTKQEAEQFLGLDQPSP